MALMSEWFAQTALWAAPDKVLQGLEDLRVVRGLTLDAEMRAPLRIIPEALEERGDLIILPLRLESAEDGQSRLHARARAVLGPALKKPDGELLSIPAGRGPSSEQCYAERLFHGSSLQVIRKVLGLSAAGIAAELDSAPAPEEWMLRPANGCWVDDPAVLDGIFQLMIVWSEEVMGAPSLPVKFNALHVYQRPWPIDGVSVRIQVTDRKAGKALANAQVLDGLGRIVASLEGYECVVDGSLRASFAQRTLQARAGAAGAL
jgi:hypothetical protein